VNLPTPVHSERSSVWSELRAASGDKSPPNRLHSRRLSIVAQMDELFAIDARARQEGRVLVTFCVWTKARVERLERGEPLQLPRKLIQRIKATKSRAVAPIASVSRMRRRVSATASSSASGSEFPFMHGNPKR
jgi:hypothetical protein